MLEGLLAWFLNTYVGEYVENLNTDQLSIGLLQGQVELENLPLKKDALKHLGLPIEIRAGFIGKINLRIPIYRLRSEPWVINIEKLYVVAGKVSYEEYDEEKEAAAAQHRKLSRLDAIEQKWKAEFESQSQEESYYAHSYLSWLSYGTSLMSNVIENLQLNIKDIHIRYEDELLPPNSPFACGILIHYLTAQSTDEYWVPKFVTKDKTNVMCKLVEIGGLAVYWDTAAEMLNHSSHSDMMLAMQKLIDDDKVSEKPSMKHEYILEPVGIKAQLKHNCSSKEMRSRRNPRLICDLQLEKFCMKLNECQYKQMAKVTKEFERLDISWKYRKWRPNVSIKENPRRWWQFAIQSHLETINKKSGRRTWDFVLHRAHNIVLYCQLYRNYLLIPDGLSFDTKAEKDELEHELEFDELCILRGIVMDKIQKEHSLKKAEVPQFQSQGILQRWFPGWKGWYTSTEDVDTAEVVVESPEIERNEEIEKLKSKLEEELLGAFESNDYDAILQHDRVCAQLNFSLMQSTVTIMGNCSEALTSDSYEKEIKPIIEFELFDVETKIETRPRRGSLLFSIKLGAMYLHDRVTPNSVFPCLVAPQNRENSHLYSKFSAVDTSALDTPLRQMANYSLRIKKSLASSANLVAKNHPLFELTYDRKPLGSSADHRLIVNSLPLDVVYNPTTLRSVIEFFSFRPNAAESFREDMLAETPMVGRAQYEAFKSQTKAEIRQKLDEIFEGDQILLDKSCWEINLAISAPEIIVPENFQDPNGTVVVFDLGKLHFYNAAKLQEKKSESTPDEEEEDFITPCSTPPKTPIEEVIAESDIQWEGLSFGDHSTVEESDKETNYERYTLNLNDMQILVSQNKDNWRFAQSKGTSTLHVIDRFSVSLQMERQLISTKTPYQPNITLYGKLPKLVLHVSEQKVAHLQACLDIISTPLISYTDNKTSLSSSYSQQNLSFSSSLNEFKIEDTPREQSGEVFEQEQQEALLFLMCFCIEEVSVEVQSRGRSIVELQVTGVKTTFSKHLCDTSLTLCVHSLLLVDALQTFGPDFELLIASHRNVCMDSMSGSLHGSEHQSMNISSRTSSSPQCRSGQSSPPEYNQNQLFLPKVLLPRHQPMAEFIHYPSYALLTGDIPTSDALIMVEFVSVTTQPTKKDNEYVAEQSYIASVQFNSLDITGNQETIVELIDFLKRIFTNMNKERKISVKDTSLKSSPKKSLSEITQSESCLPTRVVTHTELTFDFHRLNILLLRALSKKHNIAGQKVATATMSGARFQASIGTSMQIQGTLCGFQVLDLITERNKHQRILSVGQDPLVSPASDVSSALAHTQTSTVIDTEAENTNKAFFFTIRREFCKTPNHSAEEKFTKKLENETLEVRVRMASLFYIHSPRLLCELSSCATEFKEYMAILASSIKSAAAEVAIGIMSKRIEVPSMYGSMVEISPNRKQFGSSDRTTYLPHIFSEEKVHLDLKLDILLHTPVIVFPSAPHSRSVLVAHLGQITVQNDSQNISSSDADDPFVSSMVAIDISDMNLFSLNIKDNMRLLNKEAAANHSVQDIYSCSTFGQAILHNTIIKVEIKNTQFIANSHEDEEFWFGKEATDDLSIQKEEKSIFEVYGYVVTPLKVVLTKSQYEQLMTTLDYIAYSSSTNEDNLENTLAEVKRATPCGHENFSAKSVSEVPSDGSYQTEKRSTYRSSSQVHATFVMSDLTVELVTDYRIGQHSLVLATFKEFILNYEQDDAFVGNVQVTLQSLMIEDLLQLPESKHRYLMKSTGNLLQKITKSNFFKPSFLSTSCPNIISHAAKLYMDQSGSLPDHLSTQNAFSVQLNKAQKLGKRIENTKALSTSNNQGSYPNTPPPSPSARSEINLSENALVHINITFVDRNCSLYGRKYDHIDRFINANFNCLETTANMKTWLMVLDFFKNNRDFSNKNQNLSSKPITGSSCTENFYQTEDKNPPDDVNSKIELKVRSLTLVLCKQDYELAKANISSFGCCIVFKDDNISMEGKLGSASVIDLTLYGKCYPERFITSGDEALHFHIFKYGEEDWELRRDFDIAAKFRMCSVRYIHTNRFYMEIMNFVQNFFDVQDMLQIHSSKPENIFQNYTNLRRSRIKMDIAAGSPVIIIPQSFSSPSVLVANLGKLTVHNVFLFAGSPGTISTALAQTDRNLVANKMMQDITNKKQLQGSVMSDPQSYDKCLLDVMFLELSDIDLHAAVRLTKRTGCETKKEVEFVYPSFVIKKEGFQLLEKFMLKVQVERNLHSPVCHIVPDMIIKGTFSSLYFTIDLEQYKLIRGVLSYNLGEEMEDIVAKNIQSQQTVSKVFDQVWTTMAIHLELVNVTVDIVSNHCSTECMNSTTPLAKFDFIRSRLSLEIYSDNAKDIDLISHEIRVSDTRYKDAPVNNRPNVFTSILQPIKESESMSLPQAELHYIVKHSCTSFIISLNCMRVMSIFDWSADVLNFLCCELDPSIPFDPNKRDLDASSLQLLTSSTQVVGAPIIIKLYLTDTEVVVVEDPSLWDTNAVILKTTASLKWTPRSCVCPMMCEFRSMEVFSCILGIEEETALSIIDPVSFTIEIVKTDNGVLQLTEEIIHVLKIKLENLNFRLSYHDVTMFIRILESFTRQTGLQYDKSKDKKTVEESAPSSELLALQGMGYKKEDCIKALTVCKEDLHNAAVWLTTNASHSDELMVKATDANGNNSYFNTINLQAMHFSVSRGCLCIIDDCRDSDVPLLEITVTNLEVDQSFTGVHRGNATFVISIDYYNRALSGWEPFIEPWRCNVRWNFFTKVVTNQLQKISFEIEAEKTLNVNITAALLDLYQNVKENWVEEYYKTTGTEKTDLGHESTYRRRSPFVPFAIRNDTGCKLWFATTIALSDKISMKDSKSSALLNVSSVNKLDWMEVHSGQVIPFSFGARDKLRHKDSHRLRKHQLIVKIDGWQQLPPVSVDQVGVFFRFAKPQLSKAPHTQLDVLPTRLVYSVTLEGSARKLITIRSGLLLTNKCDDTMEMKMENVNLQCTAQRQTLYLVSHTTLAVPLLYLHSQIWIRPVDKAVVYSANPILWQHVVKPGIIGGKLNICKSVIAHEKHYRISICVKRERYLTDSPRGSIPSSTSQRLVASPRHLSHQPGHKIFLIPPAKITNLLPYELHYIVKDKETQMSGYIKPGHHAALHNVDVSDILTFEFSFENFQKCNELIVRPSSREFLTRLLMYDNLERLLVLQARVIPLNAGAMKINISSPYWLINKSGLPLVFRQEGTQIEAAGQSDEHELARSVVPLLFSFADRDASAMCTMRIGQSLHSGSVSHWCNCFHLEKSIKDILLYVTPRDTRPDWVYTIGIDIRMGRGRYRDTYMVTFSPRYQLDNRSSHKLEYIQKFGIENMSQQYSMSAMPKCNMPFHWPRVDLDNLLCVRLADVPDCMWSGGFSFDDKINSFHLNMRDGDGKSHFLRVEILLNGATYYIIFTDADKMPPPLRIDNHSEVSIIYYQTNVKDERLKTSVRPGSCIPYALDEPSLPSMITCSSPGGSTATYNMNKFGEGDKLYYRNFIYLAFKGTFQGSEDKQPVSMKNFSTSNQNLVLDVVEGTTKVILNKKEPGKRSQLWRMAITGLLHHEGSSPPQDPHKKISSKDLARTWVLDIAGLSPLPGIYVSLMLRKPDERRRLTQTWHFTEDGRLCCDHPNMFVQPRDGFHGLVAGNEAVLGPSQPVVYMTMPNDIPFEQAIVRQKLRGGSGVLSVKVIPDGPTRVLQISDLRQKQLVSMTASSSDWVVVKENNKTSKKPEKKSVSPKMVDLNVAKTKDTFSFHLFSHISGGIGISMINHISEELVYICLHNIMIEYNKTNDGHSIDGSIQNIQVDNQLREAERPVFLFVTPPSKKDQQRHLPALHITCNKISTMHLNAEIFKHLIITVKGLSIQAEEMLIFKLLQFAGYNQSDAELEKMKEGDAVTQRALLASSACTCRYYFNTLKLSLPQVRLSVLTSGRLSPELQHIKKKMGWKLIRFEDAVIELDPFVRVHPFETAQFLVDGIVEHYTEELKSQAAKILGAVDFLGNPLGLVNDVSDGISDFINEGDVGGLFKNVAHGLSDSAAKVTGSLSESLGLVAMDDHHQQVRKRIKQDNIAAGSDHLIAGLKGLGYGLFGGLTSVVTQTYEGAATEGVQGFFSGLGKGIVGTVTKPAVGFLDLATGAAVAVRDTSRRSSHTVPERCRLPRVCFSPGRLLPQYNREQADGQQVFFSISTDNQERFLSRHWLRRTEGMELLITDQYVFVINRNIPSGNTIILKVPFNELLNCSYIQSQPGEVRHYIQLTMKSDTPVGTDFQDQPSKRPQVRCDTQAVAQRVIEEINYIRELYEERFYTLVANEAEDVDDDHL